MQKTQDWEEAEFVRSKARQEMCKNAHIEVVEEVEEAEGNGTPVSWYDVVNTGCQYPRRDKSAFCDKCSALHHNENKV
jgi:hypothetical protein